MDGANAAPTCALSQCNIQLGGWLLMLTEHPADRQNKPTFLLDIAKERRSVNAVPKSPDVDSRRFVSIYYCRVQPARLWGYIKFPSENVGQLM